jgi:amino acid transporter
MAQAQSVAGAVKREKPSSGRLGAFLCWAVVYADIGTSIYYVPGILYGHVGAKASTFVLMTSIAFIFLATKYAHIAGRYKEGGGVVTVSTEAFGSFFGCLGGMLIVVDYFLTSSISAASGMTYLASIFESAQGNITALAIGGIVLLGLVNVVGIRESASLSAGFALVAFVVSAVVVVTVATGLSSQEWVMVREHLFAGKDLPWREMLVGYSAAWLAFSGLESISQLSPAMREPRQKVASVAMGLVVLAVLITSPLLTAFSTVLPQVNKHESERFISELAGTVSRTGFLKIAVVLSASALLVLAANTAIIGCYHVFLALAKQGFLPAAVSKRHKRLGTPTVAIAVATCVPVGILLVTGSDMALLGDLYAFGLLGAFTLSSLSLDVVLWREHQRGPMTFIGMLTTCLVIVAWGTNLVVKWKATVFGGLVTLIGLLVAYAVQRGWLRAAQVGYLTAEAAERAASLLPGSRQVMILEEALDLQPLESAHTLVAIRGRNPRLIQEAVNRLRGTSQDKVYVLDVDEVPGLFYPPDVGPSEDAIEVLAETVKQFHDAGIEALPIWRMAHDAGSSIAHAASRLGVGCVLVGTTQRTAIWHMLRGNVLTELVKQMPEHVRLVIVN